MIMLKRLAHTDEDEGEWVLFFPVGGRANPPLWHLWQGLLLPLRGREWVVIRF